MTYRDGPSTASTGAASSGRPAGHGHDKDEQLVANLRRMIDEAKATVARSKSRAEGWQSPNKG